MKKGKKQSSISWGAIEGKSTVLGSISVKLIIAFIIPIALIVVLGLSSYKEASSVIISDAEISTTSTIKAKSTYIELGLNGVSERSLEILTMDEMDLYYKKRDLDVNKLSAEQMEAKSAISKRIMNTQAINDFVYNIYFIGSVGSGITTTNLQNVKPEYYNQFVETEMGKQVLDSQTTVGWMSYNDYFIELMAKEQPTYNVSEYAMTMWRKASFATTSLIFIDISQEVIDQAVSELNFGEGSLTAFIAPGGRETVFKGSSDELGSKVLPEDEISISGLSYYEKAVQSEETEGYFYDIYNGEDYLFSYAKIGNTGAILCSLLPKAMITSQAAGIRNLTFIISLIAILAAIFTCVIIAISFKKAVNNSIRSLNKASGGDLTVTFDTKRTDEFGIISRSITSMVDGIRDLIRQMNSVGSDVNASASNVSTNIDQLLASTKEISFAIEEIEEGVTTQAKDAEQCLIQMSNLSERINEVYDNTHQIEEIAGATQRITDEGIIAMEELNKTSKATNDITSTIIDSIEDLAVQTQSISGIINVMNEIAEQTNLLSLNASIEAARAGEAGRGFAVVAKEIRGLADQSMESSKKIEKIIEFVQDKTNNTVDSAKQAEDILLTQNTALKQAVDAFQNISSHVEKLIHNLNMITEGITDIEVSKAGTLDAIGNISAVSEESASASEEVGATVSNMVDAVATLNEIASELKSNAKNMDDAISVFVID